MDAKRQTREYRLLASRMRAEAELMDSAAGERKLETARAFEKIAETFERIADGRNDDNKPS
jgi:hypothetical protein